MSEQELDFEDVISLDYVLKSIAHGQNTKYTLYDDRSGLQGVPSREQQLTALDYLSNKNAITYIVIDQSHVHRSDKGSVSFITSPCDINIVDAKVFTKLQQLTENSIELLEKEKPVVLEYSQETGIGISNGLSFNLLNKTEKPFFDLLVQNIGKPTHKKNLAKTVGISMDSPKQATLEINTFVSNLRKATGMSKHQITQKGDYISLNANLYQST